MRENFTYGLMKGALIALSIIIFNQILIDRAIRLYSTQQVNNLRKPVFCV